MQVAQSRFLPGETQRFESYSTYDFFFFEVTVIKEMSTLFLKGGHYLNSPLKSKRFNFKEKKNPFLPLRFNPQWGIIALGVKGFGMAANLLNCTSVFFDPQLEFVKKKNF